MIHAAGLTLDVGHCLLPSDKLTQLCDALKNTSLEEKRSALFAGNKINLTEHRAAWHTALRDPTPPQVIHDALAQMANFVDGNTYTHIVNIGIGGSDLGPRMVCQALKPFAKPGVHTHFVSNIDPADLLQTLQHCDPSKTLIIATSKTFTTLETLENLKTAMHWLRDNKADISKQVIAVTAAPDKALEHGIQQHFPLWDFVGGRYSLWSAVGLPIALQCGMDLFNRLLAGAHAMDQHFLQTPFSDNMPVVMAVLDQFYQQEWGTNAKAILPYAHNLQHLPRYLQQLVMESLGKSVTTDGQPVAGRTSPVIWGEPGTVGQHAFHQMLLQGTDIVPVDFIIVEQPAYPGTDTQHRWLVANAQAQAQALHEGTPHESNPHQRLPGGRPSNSIILEKLDAANLGALIALYEHKTFVQAVMWGINPFDQFGVEHGKMLAKKLYQ